MKIEEVAVDCGRSGITIRRWIKAGKLPAKRKGLREVYIDPAEWERFCKQNNIIRRPIEK